MVLINYLFPFFFVKNIELQNVFYSISIFNRTTIYPSNPNLIKKVQSLIIFFFISLKVYYRKCLSTILYHFLKAKETYAITFFCFLIKNLVRGDEIINRSKQSS